MSNKKSANAGTELRSTTESELITQTHDEINSRLVSVLSRVSNLSDNLLGGEPKEPMAEDTKAPEPYGLASAMRMRQNTSHDLINSIEQCLNRIDSFI